MTLENVYEHTIKVAVIGAGYVGLPMAIALSRNNRVVLYDVDDKKIDLLKKGVSYIADVRADELTAAISKHMLQPTNDEDMLAKVDCFIICVPTPLDKNKQPELKYIEQASNLISRYIEKNSLVILESTTYPGTTEELIKPILEKNGLKCSEDFYLAFSPERVDPGNKEYNTSNTTKIVGGVSQVDTEMAKALYECNLNCEVFAVSSPAVAEMSKILENTYRNVNIGLINEFAQICNRMNIDIWEVIEAAKTKPFGFHAFYPGPGVGGHCIPLDPFYLEWKIREYGMSSTMIEASGKIIENMPEYIVSRVFYILNEYGKALNGARILVVGVAYKANVSDCRESPSIDIIDKLMQKKAIVSFYDTYVGEISIRGSILKSLTLSEINNQWDIIVILTNHSNVDYGIFSSLKGIPIFDTRNALKDVHSDSIIKL